MGLTSTNAVLVWTPICIGAGAHIADTTHIAGKAYVICDALSKRGVKDAPMSRQEIIELGLAGTTILDLESEAATVRYLWC